MERTPSITSFLARRPLATRYKAPGRINIIGEHTDYNDGFVLPGASHLHLTFAVEPTLSKELQVHACRYAETVTVELEDPTIRMDHWSRYVAAVVHTTRAHDLPLTGLEIIFEGNLPAGAGMSSSSALTCGLIFILNHQCGWQLPVDRLIKLAQESEHRTGVRGGLMDQFAIFSARRQQALLLDCRSLEAQFVSISQEGATWCLVDSGVHHNLLDSPYNQRREACERMVALAARKDPAIRALRDLNLQTLHALAPEATPEDLAMARHVVTENDRVLQMVQALQEEDWAVAGALLLQSHQSLRDDYRVSCIELDFLVDSLMALPGVFGARLMGAGFGGSVLFLTEPERFTDIQTTIQSTYQQQFNRTCDVYCIELDDGVQIIDHQQNVVINE
ncbi:MAG: galactokinase [Saprospiraceae bacterium]|nr:galactokinase [Saprospiraceae bacterium]